MVVAAIVIAVVATGLADFRWWRVAQREHYIPGSATQFALRWWLLGPNPVLGVVAVVNVVLSAISPVFGIVGCVAIAAGPWKYPLKGVAPGPVVWTTRLKTVAAATGALQVVLIAAGALLGAGAPVSAAVALISPLLIDGVLFALRPVEDRKAEVWVDKAKAKLEQIDPLVVAITGSYGKTTTKVYAAHLMQGARSTVPTPRSLNNRAGLSIAVNEHLIAGTEVFIAEMGTYGKGEIADMCAWCPPSVAAITAIGPVHLERFGTEDAIVEAKSEIFAFAGTAVLNVDDARLAKVADAQAALGKKVFRCSDRDRSADVCATVDGERLLLFRQGRQVADVPVPDAVAGNVAVAAALAFAVDVPEDVVASRMSSFPAVPNRRAVTTLSTGAAAIDDTFNSNPAGCREALRTLDRMGSAAAKRVVVTPGMVELGARQAEENATFSASAARDATHVIIVGFTNRKALLSGIDTVPEDGRAEVMLADRHARAVTWVQQNTGAGDVVLYENQLPDHYP